MKPKELRFAEVGRSRLGAKQASIMGAAHREAKPTQKLGKGNRFLSQHPYCCFCGGGQKSTTMDHVPPKASFPDGYLPEDLEFPACEACNHGSKRHDQIFGFYCQLLDFDPANRTVADRAKLTKLRDAIARNYRRRFRTRPWRDPSIRSTRSSRPLHSPSR